MSTIALGAGTRVALGPRIAQAAVDATQQRDLNILQYNDVTALDPHRGTYASDCSVASNVFDTLVRRHADGTLRPGVATVWGRTGPTTWRLSLRQDLRWHDGSRVTAIDVKYSLDRTFDPSVKAASLVPLLQTIERTETPDQETLIIHTRYPDVLIPARLAVRGWVVPWTYVDRVGYTEFNQRPLGSGPFRFVSWTKGDRCILEANPSYWEGRVDLDRVILRPMPDPSSRVDALLRGEADLITGLPPVHNALVASHASTRVVGALYAGLYVLAVNTLVAPLNDPLVRQALSRAIDRETIVKQLWRGRALVPNGPIPRGDNHYEGSLAPLPYDARGARDRLRRAGYRGEPIFLETTVGYLGNDKSMTDLIAEMWEDVGVNVVVEVITPAARHLKNLQQTYKGLWWSDPTSLLHDPDGMMARLLSPGQLHDYWRDPEFERLRLAARFSGDETVRGDAYRRMTAIFLEHNPWIVIVQPYEDYGLRRYVEFTPSSEQQCDLRRGSFRLRRV